MEQERNSLEKLYELQSEKIARIREALIVETDPSRKFQYEQQIQQEEKALQALSDKLGTACAKGDRIDEIEQQLVSSTPVTSESQKINQKILILAAIPQSDNLRLDKEIREIRTAIERAIKRDLFEVEIRTAVRPQDK